MTVVLLILAAALFGTSVFLVLEAVKERDDDPEFDEITVPTEGAIVELASDDGDGHAARAVEARLSHDAHLRPAVEHEPVRQPLAIEAAPRDRKGGASDE